MLERLKSARIFDESKFPQLFCTRKSAEKFDLSTNNQIANNADPICSNISFPLINQFLPKRWEMKE